jgi:hypothetical protein
VSIDGTSLTVDQAYQQGYDAKQAGTRMSENPFHPGSQPDLYDAWKDGWTDRDGWERKHPPTEEERSYYDV